MSITATAALALIQAKFAGWVDHQIDEMNDITGEGRWFDGDAQARYVDDLGRTSFWIKNDRCIVGSGQDAELGLDLDETAETGEIVEIGRNHYILTW